MTAAFWGPPFLIAWLAFAWTPLGIWAIVALAGAMWGDLLRRRRRTEYRPGLPPPFPRHAQAAGVLLALAVLILVGYRADWLVAGLLIVAGLLRLADAAAPGGGARAGGQRSS